MARLRVALATHLAQIRPHRCVCLAGRCPDPFAVHGVRVLQQGRNVCDDVAALLAQVFVSAGDFVGQRLEMLRGIPMPSRVDAEGTRSLCGLHANKQSSAHPTTAT